MRAMTVVTVHLPRGGDILDNRPGHTVVGLLYSLDPFQRYESVRLARVVHTLSMSARSGPELFLDDHRGIYIPRDFANRINRQCWFGISDEEFEALSDPDHDLYWEAWDAVCDTAFAYVPHKAGWQYFDAPTLALAHAADEAGNTVERDRLLATLPGMRWNVYQDGACWLIPDGMTFTDSGEWVWPDDEDDEFIAFSEVLQMKVGDRVKVKVLDPQLYSVGAAKALSGMIGTVESIGNSTGVHVVRVKFDRAAPTWWAHQMPPTGGWFEPGELELMP